MATTDYIIQPQLFYGYLSSNPKTIQSWDVDGNTFASMFNNGFIMEIDYEWGYNRSLIYLTEVRGYEPGGGLVVVTKGLRVPISATLTSAGVDSLLANVPMYVSLTPSDDIYTAADPNSPTERNSTVKGSTTIQIDAEGGTDVFKIEDTYASGKYSFTRSASGDVIVTIKGENGPTTLKNFEDVYFTDLGRMSFESFLAPKLVTYTLTPYKSSLNEGDIATFLLSTTGLAAGTSLPYFVFGISESDLWDPTAFKGTVTVNEAGDTSLLFVIKSDRLTEGDEYISVNIANGAAIASSRIYDTSTTPVNEASTAVASYEFTDFSSSINEGDTALFKLNTKNVVAGTLVGYQVTGVSSADIFGANRFGTAVVDANGVATISVTLLNDNLTEGAETLTVTAGGVSASITVNDTSKTVVAGNTLDVIVDLFGNVSMLKGLIEVDNGTVHTLSYNGTVFNYAEVDPLITTVVRNGEFTAEFAQEIADAYPSAAGIKYNTVVTLFGVAAIDDLLISVAGADGFYVS